jgi:hypothetical protein
MMKKLKKKKLSKKKTEEIKKKKKEEEIEEKTEKGEFDSNEKSDGKTTNSNILVGGTATFPVTSISSNANVLVGGIAMFPITTSSFPVIEKKSTSSNANIPVGGIAKPITENYENKTENPEFERQSCDE